MTTLDTMDWGSIERTFNPFKRPENHPALLEFPLVRARKLAYHLSRDSHRADDITSDAFILWDTWKTKTANGTAKTPLTDKGWGICVRRAWQKQCRAHRHVSSLPENQGESNDLDVTTEEYRNGEDTEVDVTLSHTDKREFGEIDLSDFPELSGEPVLQLVARLLSQGYDRARVKEMCSPDMANSTWGKLIMAKLKDKLAARLAERENAAQSPTIPAIAAKSPVKSHLVQVVAFDADGKIIAQTESEPQAAAQWLNAYESYASRIVIVENGKMETYNVE